MVGAVPGHPRTAATRAKHKARQRRVKSVATAEVGAAIQLVVESGTADIVVSRETSTAEVLAWALRRVHATMLWAAKQTDALPAEEFWVNYWDAQGNIRTEPNKWFKLERTMREEAVKLAARMVELGLAERAVAIEEAKAVMVAQAVRTAAEAAGLAPEQITRLGEELRKGLESGAIQDTEAVAV